MSDAGIAARMASYLKRIATGPEMSKDLTREEARDGMELVLRGAVDSVQAGVFLVALRMKRESDDENRGVLDALRASTQAALADVPDLVDLADPYDGFVRHLPAAPFLPAVLAACGVPAVSHGCRMMGPKFGLSHHQILAAACTPVDLTSDEAAARTADPTIGWAYVDQRAFHPELHALIELRRLIVKRPCLSTLEKLCGPVRAGTDSPRRGIRPFGLTPAAAGRARGGVRVGARDPRRGRRRDPRSLSGPRHLVPTRWSR
jgi:anthranilate phosphoribosyltransferase